MYIVCIILGIILFLLYNNYDSFNVGAKIGDWYIAKYIGTDGIDKYEKIKYINENQILQRLRELRAFYLFGYNQRRNEYTTADIRLPRFTMGEGRRPPYKNRVERIRQSTICINRILNMINDNRNGFTENIANDYIFYIGSHDLFYDFEYNPDEDTSPDLEDCLGGSCSAAS
jgi:hypothetical protein